MAIHIDSDAGGTPTTQTRYLHRERLSYDAFGKGRNATTWQGAPPATPAEVRGYIGHEHLSDVGLIHMNGRVYDPQLGRMLSAVPLVPNPLDGQSWNRYSYVLNNPLSRVDPSGFSDSQLSRTIFFRLAAGIHNQLCNPYMPTGVQVLACKPDWTIAISDPARFDTGSIRGL